MILLIAFKLICLSQLFVMSYQITINQTSVVLVQVATRHGVRTILQRYPTYPISDSFWDNLGGYGMLSPVGVVQMNQFGQYLRGMYPTLNKTFDKTRVYARSTDKDRTLNSCYSFLSGFFPPTTQQQAQIYANKTTFNPIAVHTENINTDQILRADNCPKYSQLKAQAHQSSIFLKQQTANYNFLVNMTKLSGLNLTKNYYGIWQIADNALVDKAHNLTTAQWIKNNYKQIMMGNDYTFFIDFITVEMAKLTSGGLLNSIVTNIKNKVAGSSYELFLFGVHDNYLSAIQKLLNTSTTFTQPNFGSAFIFELRKDSSNNYYVQVLYKNDVYPNGINIQPVKIYGCDQLCPIKKFYNITAPNLVPSYDTICNV